MSAVPATRLRRTDALRSLVRETRLDLDDFVQPLFVGPSTVRNDDLPGMSRYSVDDLVAEASELTRLGVKAVILFGIPDEKDDEGSGAWDDDGVIQRALRALRAEQPELVLLTDVCLCEYTSHGHCGVLRDGEVVNDETLELLVRTAVSHVDAGADAVAPSDMMDGRVGAIREALPDTPILAYAAKYASAFYGPFRDVAESAPSEGDRRGYQMDPANAREALRECELDLDDFVQPLFVGPTTVRNDDLPGLSRYSVDDLVAEAGELTRLGVKAVILFGIPDEKDEEGSGAWDEDGVIQRALRAVRSEQPELVLLTDVCLCEYTSHGHCGVLRDGEVVNDETVELLVRTAVSHVDAGADAVAPSDMMDGRVGAIREQLPETPIVAYSAKYATAFYGPFREAAESTPSFGDRRSYQMDPPNVREALRECELDLAEGADVLMVKPALPYLDVLRAVRERFDAPVAAYNVSGEYAMVKAAARHGWLDERTAALESLTAIKRAGADLVVSYWTKELAGWL